MTLSRLRNLSFLVLVLVYAGGNRAQLEAQAGCPSGSTCYECQAGAATTTCIETPNGGDNWGIETTGGCSDFVNWTSFRNVHRATCDYECVEVGGHDDFVYSFTSYQESVDSCHGLCQCTDEGGGGPPEM